MGSPGGWTLWILWVCVVVQKNAALSVSVRDSSVQTVQGDSVTLYCSFLTSGSLTRLNVIWTLVPFSNPENPIQVIMYDHGQVIEEPSLIGRVGFTGLPTRADIILNDTRVSDAGIYRCMVNNPPETADPGIGELELSILAPPSLPVCQWDGDIDVGGNVLLSCSVSEGSPTPEIHWAKMDPEEEVSLPIDMEGDLGSIQIFNVSSQNSGLYRCSATNELGTENCYVNLSIYSTPDGPSGILQGVLLTLAMTLVLLALLVLIMWLRHTGQDGNWRDGKVQIEEDDCYNEIRYTPSLMKLSFV